MAAEVPYSGDRWDLINDYQLQQGPRTLAGEAAKAAEAEADLDTGRLMPRKGRRAPTPAVESADRMLDNALNRLRGLIHQGHGWSNGIKKQLARQINKLCDKWE